MIQLIGLLVGGIINALEILGLQEAGRTKYFAPVLEKIKGVLPGWMSSPLFSCHKCMASVHGTLFYVFVMGRGDIMEYLFYIPFVCGLTVLFSKV